MRILLLKSLKMLALLIIITTIGHIILSLQQERVLNSVQIQRLEGLEAQEAAAAQKKS